MGLKNSRASQTSKNDPSSGAKNAQEIEEWHWGQGLNKAMSSLLYMSTHESHSACPDYPHFLRTLGLPSHLLLRAHVVCEASFYSQTNTSAIFTTIPFYYNYLQVYYLY